MSEDIESYPDGTFLGDYLPSDPMWNIFCFDMIEICINTNTIKRKLWEHVGTAINHGDSHHGNILGVSDVSMRRS